MSSRTLAAAASCSLGFPAPECSGVAPGRLTLIGEHIDYVGGKVACIAIDLHVAVASRRSPDRWRMSSSGRTVERRTPAMTGEFGDRVFAACIAAAEVTGDASPAEIAIVSDLPEGAGLSSSAAVTCATLLSRFKSVSVTIGSRQLVELAIRAERDIAGIPCGEMDQWAVVGSRQGQVTVLDAASRQVEFISWPWQDLCFVVVYTGASHDNATSGYRLRRQEAEAVIFALGVANAQEIGDRWEEIDPTPLRRRARHLGRESQRVEKAIATLHNGDKAEFGRLLSESHDSLATDYEVSTPDLDRVVLAATQSAGCLGARMIGGGFGGSVMALCSSASANETRSVMVRAAGRTGIADSWILTPASGALPL